MSIIFEEPPGDIADDAPDSELTEAYVKNPFLDAMNEADTMLRAHANPKVDEINAPDPDLAISKYLEAMSFAENDDQLQQTHTGLAMALFSAGRLEDALGFALEARAYFRRTRQIAEEQKAASLLRNIEIDMRMAQLQ